MVFDEFWREGELALMFGEAGTGKSLQAMQLADALAEGSDIPWSRMECAASGHMTATGSTSKPANANLFRKYADVGKKLQAKAQRSERLERGGSVIICDLRFQIGD